MYKIEQINNHYNRQFEMCIQKSANLKKKP